MITFVPMVIDSGKIGRLQSGNKLGGVTGGTASGEVMTQDQFGLNYSKLAPGGGPAFTGAVLTTPDIGQPSAGTLTNCIGLPISSGVSGLASGVATFLATPNSANFAAAVTDETGSGPLVFATSPQFTQLVGIGVAASATIPLSITKGAITNDTSLAMISMSGGTDATLGPMLFQFGVHPSATGGSRYAYFAAGDTAANRPIAMACNGGVSPSFGNVALGSITAAARLEVRSTTEQVRTAYDASNYESTTVSNAGVVTRQTAGTNAGYDNKTTGTGGWTVNTGSQIRKLLTATASLDFPSIAANTTAELTITVTGAAVGDDVTVVPSGAPENGLVWSGYVSASNTVTVRIGNVTTGAIDPAARTWRATVRNF